MFDNIITLKKRSYENFATFGGGDTTNINETINLKKSFENNQKINRSMMVDSITKLVNNIASKVVQDNSANAASVASASNIVWISDVKCKDVLIAGINQSSDATNITQMTSTQSNTSKISTEIATSIDKTIEKIGHTDLDKLAATNAAQLNEFMNAMPGYDPDKAHNLAGACPSSGGSFISANNTCNVNSTYNLDASVKQALDLDESFKINDNDNISNDINSMVSQINFASCQASANASNAMIIKDIQCDVNLAMAQAKKLNQALADPDTSERTISRLQITDNSQKAIAKLFMTCVFDQKSVSDISNKITNSISKKFNQIYDAVAKKAEGKGQKYYDDKMKILDTFAAAGVEKIMAAAGDLKPKSVDTSVPKPDTTPPKTDTSSPNSLLQTNPFDKTPSNTTTPSNSTDTTPQTDLITDEKPTANNLLLYGGISLGIITVIIIIILIIKYNQASNIEIET